MTKKLLWLFPVIILGFFIFTGQYNPGQDSEKWNFNPEMTGMQFSGENYSPLPTLPNDFVFSTTPRVVPMANGDAFVVSPSFRPYPTTNTTQSEVIIVRHPINPMIMWASANMYYPTGGFISEGVYVTTNGGANWFGNDTLTGAPIGGHGGDPGPTIDKNGVFLMTHLGGGIGANFSTNNGATWSNTFQIITGSQDKNLTNTDDVVGSPYYGRSYTVWTDFRSTVKPILVSYTTNGGVSWSTAQAINNPPSPLTTSQGCDVVVGPGGVVYSTWRDHGASPFTGVRVGLGKSTNGGVNWTVIDNAFAMNGVRSASFGSYGIRVPDFPRIDVDKSGGPRNGWIYIVTNEFNLAPSGSDADVIMNISSNGGTTWTRKRVNQDPLNNGKLQFFPALDVDDNGGVNVVYYDNRNTASDSAQVYVARSVDGGNTWEEVIASDHRFRPRAISGLAGGYQGDYIGITTANNKIWPVWMDNSTGIYQLWSCSINIANFPLNAFNLQTPAPSTTINSLPNSSATVTFTWDTSATGASYKWIFGAALPVRQITMPSGSNSLTMTLGQLDNILAGLGLSPGQQIVGAWDVWATRPNPPANDSLKAANGPRPITLRRGIPALTAFNLSTPANNSTITTSIFNSSNVGFNWTKSGDGTTYKFKFGSPTVSSQQINLGSDNGGFDTTFTRTNAQLDAMLASLGVIPGGSLVGQWAVYAYNGQDSLKSVQTHNLTFTRSGVTALFYDDFSAGTGQWNITNDGGTCVWQTFNTPYPNAYTMPAASLPPVLSADADNCGSGTSTNSTITVVDNINCTGYQNITIEWDNDWNAIDAKDFARVQVSYNGGSTWVTVSEFNGTDVRNTHEVRALAPATNIPNLKIRFVSVQPGYDWWWTVDNVTVKGDIMVGVTNNNSSIPDQFALYQNYPNPFNPATKIKFDIPQQSLVTIKLYDVAGREVTRLVNNSSYSPGAYSVEFNASHLASGVYFYRIEAGDFVQIKKMMLIK